MNGKNGKKRIVIAEDDPQIARLLKFNLEKSGFEVTCGENGQKALEHIREEHPDLVVLDLMMPIMDGGELMRIIKADEETSGIPAIILTARGMEDDILKGFESGAVDYMVKPFSVSELAARVKSCLARAS